MAWPTIVEYNAAFASPAGRIMAPGLSGARAKPGPFGTPLPLSGGFAYIYEVSLPSGQRKAVRCFSRDEPVRRARAKAACEGLASALRRHPEVSHYFVDVRWEEQGIRAGSLEVPIVVMDWAEGQILGQYVEAHYRDARAMKGLRLGLEGLASGLAKAGIIHGDLQSGNVMIGAGGGIRLLDYDGLAFVGEKAGPELEAGHVHFQHPVWSEASPFELKDRFPSIVIDLSLRALELEPGLYREHSSGENLVFSRDDYLDPESSGAFRDVGRLPGLGHAAELLAGLCRSPIEILPSLADFQAEAYRAGAEATGQKGARQEAATAAAPGNRTKRKRGPYAGPYRVLSGDDYVRLSEAVGQKVEVIGRIVSVKANGVTKYGKPYAFVNFGDWKSDEFKLTIWSEGLETFDEPPDSSWEGRYVSVMGLVDEPYFNDRSCATQISITIQDSSQVRFIRSREAAWRLGKATARSMDEDWEEGDAASRHNAMGSNADILQGLGPQAHAARPVTTSRAPGKPSNAELLAKLSEPKKGGLTILPPSSQPSSPPVKSDNSGCITVILLILAGIFFIQILPLIL